MGKNELITNPTFNYSLVSPDTKGKLIWAAGEINKINGQVISRAIELGQVFSVAKQLLRDHGEKTFSEWVESETAYGKSSAYQFIAVYERFGDFPIIGMIEDTALYALASKSTPEKAVKEVLKLSQQGVRIGTKLAKKIIEKHAEKGDPEPPTGRTPAATSHQSPPAQPTVVSVADHDPPATSFPVSAEAIYGDSPETVSPPEETGPAPKTDAWGIPIQPHAAPAFEAQDEFDEMLRMARELRRRYAKLCDAPGGAYLLRPGVSINGRDSFKHKGLEDFIHALEDCRPAHTVCPRMYHAAAFPESGHVHDATCNLCHGLNWSRALGKNEIDPKIIAKAKEANRV